MGKYCFETDKQQFKPISFISVGLEFLQNLFTVLRMTCLVMKNMVLEGVSKAYVVFITKLFHGESCIPSE